MSTFMVLSKRVVVQSPQPNLVLELGVATSLPFLIYERNLNTALSTASFKLEKVVGRDTTTVIAWTAIDLTLSTNDLHILELTATGATTDNLQLLFRIVDADGIETFEKVKDITVTD